MSAADDDRSTLVYALETLGPIRAEIERSPDSTLKPEPTKADAMGRAAIAALMEAAQRERTVTLGDTLGQGGMGVVHLAEQVALGRTVAVKRLKAEHTSEGNILALMREAWVTGSLEHPNIVPVHDVGLDADGQPFLVMKRIEGEHWGRLIGQPDEVRRRFGVTDVQAWHLGVLQQVCHAVAFAHSRGVVHRDLKPENVMVGAFGEVYLLDWGIAATLLEDPSGRMPHVRPGSIVGTPAYMAPEMLGRGQVGPLSDVYLLGGLLYEVLTGGPPHHGRDLDSLVRNIEISQPDRPEGPDELVDLCVEALASDPAERPESAEVFRLRLARHIEHRGALQLAEQAEQSLAQLLEGLEQPDSDPDEHWHHFGEARFGFQQALKAWPEHVQAARGLRRAVTAMVRFELAQGDPIGARRLLSADPVNDDALNAEVSRALEDVRLQERDRDETVGQRTRWFVAVLLATVWSILPMYSWYSGSVPTYRRATTLDLLFVGMVIGLGIWARESLSKTALNRKTWGILLLVPLCQMVLAAGAWRMGLSVVTAQSLNLFLWSTIAAVATVSIEWRLFPTAVAYTAGALVVSGMPEDFLLVTGLANAILGLNIGVMWWPGPRPPEDPDVS